MADIDGSGDQNITFRFMKTNCWLVLGLMIATSGMAQTNAPALPPIPAPLTTPPAAEAAAPAPAPAAIAPAPAPAKPATATKPVHHKKAKIAAAAPKKVVAPFTEPTVALVPGPAQIAVKNLNLRGQAGLKGEFITHASQGDTLTVLSQITLDKHKAGEPAQWAKVNLPASVHVWVHSNFIDPTNKVVSVKKLNLRAGPGENYSVLGVLERGAPITEVTSKNGWTQIEAPTNAYAFVAAMYLKQEASGTMATNIPASAETEPTPTPVMESQPIVTEPPTNAAPVVDTTPAPAPVVMDQNNTALVDTNTPPPPRIVTHEGLVRHVRSIIEPTNYELYDPNTGNGINYLYTTSTNLDLGSYNGQHIIVTGEEGMAVRWKNSPVLTVQSIEVLPLEVPAPVTPIHSPRAK